MSTLTLNERRPVVSKPQILGRLHAGLEHRVEDAAEQTALALIGGKTERSGVGMGNGHEGSPFS